MSNKEPALLPRKRSLPITTSTNNNQKKNTENIDINNNENDNDKTNKDTETTTTASTYYKQIQKITTHYKKRNVIASLILLLYLKSVLFGFYSLRGGLIGLGIDKYVKSRVNRQSQFAYRDKYEVSSIPDPRMYYERYHALERDSLLCLARLCSSSRSDSSKKKKKELQQQHAIPMYLLQAPKDLFEAGASLGSTAQNGIQPIFFSDVHVRRVLRDVPLPPSSATPKTRVKKESSSSFKKKVSPLIALYSSRTMSESDRVLLFGIASVYTYGGFFLSNYLVEQHLPLQPFVSYVADLNSIPTSCHSPFAMTVNHPLTRDDSSPTDTTPLSEASFIDASVLVATPRHPALLSTLRTLLSLENVGVFMSTTYNTTYLPSLLAQHINLYNRNSGSELPVQILAHCCNELKRECSIHLPTKTAFTYTIPPPKQHSTAASTNFPVQLYQEAPYLPPSQSFFKNSLHVKMILKRCEPSWLCNRCLRYAGLGTYAKCSNVCKQCFIDIMCDATATTKTKLYQPVDLYMNRTRLDKAERYIPKIIHQTWFEQLTIERYPHLIRLQNSWRASGWEYRFYDDFDARNFILEHFPSIFIQAYDALIPGAFKADFFRYLVLLVSGGVYADIDVLLETTLDTLITPNLSFITARDTVGQENNAPFCLWNGFIGSSPGHPFLIETIQRSLNFIRNRANILDMEQDICMKIGIHTESWKIKSEQGLVLTGPCALGISVNTVLQQYPLQKIPLGFIPIPSNLYNIKGDTHILSLKKQDLGSLRISDIERNVIVATTNIPYMSKFPSVESSPLKQQQSLYSCDEDEDGENSFIRTGKNKRKHYSYASGSWDWGSKGVYVDSIVVDDYIQIFVKDVV